MLIGLLPFCWGVYIVKLEQAMFDIDISCLLFPPLRLKALAGGLSNIVDRWGLMNAIAGIKVKSSKYAAKPHVVTPGLATIRRTKYW